MPNYSYVSDLSNNAWAKCFYRMSPLAGGCAQYKEIHFTEPKDAKAGKALRPHVTFVQANDYTTHWYLEPGDGKWLAKGLTRDNKSSTANALDGEGDIATKVVADMVASNTIKNPPATTQAATDGGDDWTVKVNPKKANKSWKG